MSELKDGVVTKKMIFESKCFAFKECGNRIVLFLSGQKIVIDQYGDQVNFSRFNWLSANSVHPVSSQSQALKS